MCTLLYGPPYAVDNLFEFLLRHGGLVVGEFAKSEGPDPFGWTENGMVDFQALLLARGGRPRALELGRNLISPLLEPRVDRFEVYAGIAATPAAVSRATGASVGMRGGVLATGGLQRGIAQGEVFFVGVIAKAIRLREALVSGCRGA